MNPNKKLKIIIGGTLILFLLLWSMNDPYSDFKKPAYFNETASN